MEAPTGTVYLLAWLSMVSVTTGSGDQTTQPLAGSGDTGGTPSGTGGSGGLECYVCEGRADVCGTNVTRVMTCPPGRMCWVRTMNEPGSASLLYLRDCFNMECEPRHRVGDCRDMNGGGRVCLTCCGSNMCNNATIIEDNGQAVVRSSVFTVILGVVTWVAAF